MATRDLSSYRADEVPSGKSFRIAVITSDWNEEITHAMEKACLDTLIHHEVVEENISVIHVPGSYELTSAAQMLLETSEQDAVVCIGCIIKGETPHDVYLAQAVSQGLIQVSIDYSTPVLFGVLTTLDLQQAKERAGGRHGNKGVEAAVTALRMAALRRKFI
ncbi:MAG TPA: 6,7-dimethyl-8-ribityllumazine synthase [Chitinophagales bacterium]|nr:6,7-dimethyl-8-ribityllumazine synthase [Bacteroidota bacterium]HPE96798.1 6,7-dimethyl-8-ribityllumazine synthase [Chitinophagales bacterium]HPR30312.1 6,7-dimethyl-8-ribityllumazine synthase [Chitinophagales bacterium]HQU75498.1 6,7-dimethyl-8-ribityllumazine synthase [Chitinophagales bacterium]HRX22837.1 6,7-dimethyl-8-ribityllumazine synthase [Chitinophagales bacterium]